MANTMDLQAENFHHPYTPYELQLQFMRSLYSCLDEGKVAVFESPTGKPSMVPLIFLNEILLFFSLT